MQLNGRWATICPGDLPHQRQRRHPGFALQRFDRNRRGSRRGDCGRQRNRYLRRQWRADADQALGHTSTGLDSEGAGSEMNVDDSTASDNGTGLLAVNSGAADIEQRHLAQHHALDQSLDLVRQNRALRQHQPRHGAAPGRQRDQRLRPDLAAVNRHRSSDQHRSIPADPAFRLIWLASNARSDPGVF